MSVIGVDTAAIPPIAVKHQKRGAVRICRLNARPLRAVDLWLRDYHEFWNQSLANLKKYVEENA